MATLAPPSQHSMPPAMSRSGSSDRTGSSDRQAGVVLALQQEGSMADSSPLGHAPARQHSAKANHVDNSAAVCLLVSPVTFEGSMSAAGTNEQEAVESAQTTYSNPAYSDEPCRLATIEHKLSALQQAHDSLSSVPDVLGTILSMLTQKAEPAPDNGEQRAAGSTATSRARRSLGDWGTRPVAVRTSPQPYTPPRESSSAPRAPATSGGKHAQNGSAPSTPTTKTMTSAPSHPAQPAQAQPLTQHVVALESLLQMQRDQSEAVLDQLQQLRRQVQVREEQHVATVRRLQELEAAHEEESRQFQAERAQYEEAKQRAEAAEERAQQAEQQLVALQGLHAQLLFEKAAYEQGARGQPTKQPMVVIPDIPAEKLLSQMPAKWAQMQHRGVTYYSIEGCTDEPLEGERMLQKGPPKPGRFYAETLANKVEGIAKAYGTDRETDKPLDIAVRGEMGNRDELKQDVPNKRGNYIWCVKGFGLSKWVPVYCGKAGNEKKKPSTLKQRFNSYIHKSTFGPKHESLIKYWSMVHAMSRGFSIQIRFRPLTNPKWKPGDKEKRTLAGYNFPLNDRDNGGYRAVMMPVYPPGISKVYYVSMFDDATFPVKNQELDYMARALKLVIWNTLDKEKL